jgi:uncharacterized protein YndB with AHSA1/START domain
MTDKTITVTRVINFPIERVWQAWTNPEDLKHWFVAKEGTATQIIQFDVKVGGKVRLKFHGAGGEYTWTYIKIDKPNQLVFDILDFSLPQFNKKGAGGICTVSFKDLNGKTEVSVGGELPDEMNNESMRKMAEAGWGGTLDKLNNYLNKE